LDSFSRLKGIAIVRITAAVCSLSFALLTAAPQLAFSQDTTAQPPAAPQQNFGPRAKQPQPGAAPEGPPPSETVAKIGSWQVQCGQMPAQGEQTTKKQCGMVQVTRSEKNERIGLSLIVMKMMNGGKEVTMMRVMAPIGVYLPTGVALEIDGAAVGRVPFTRCRPQICEALAEASAPTLEKMKKGNAATFIIYEGPGAGVPMKLSLEGFSKALAELDKY
jgi:invasion protein IalB